MLAVILGTKYLRTDIFSSFRPLQVFNSLRSVVIKYIANVCTICTDLLQ